jgi:hypothetical protein
MKQIIGGRRYDTDTAILIGQHGSGSPSDFRYINEALYRTRNGRFFLAGEGGARTRWAYCAPGGGRWTGSGIQPLNRDEALDWAQSHLATDIVERHFGDCITDA